MNQREERFKKDYEEHSFKDNYRYGMTLGSTTNPEYQEKLKKKYPEEFKKSEKEVDKIIKGKGDAEKVEKDEEGNILKQEEVTDSEGKKIKVTTHTGPRGGKFYYPEGKPHTEEHKVYIDKNGKAKNESTSGMQTLTDYLVEHIS